MTNSAMIDGTEDKMPTVLKERRFSEFRLMRLLFRICGVPFEQSISSEKENPVLLVGATSIVFRDGRFSYTEDNDPYGDIRRRGDSYGVK